MTRAIVAGVVAAVVLALTATTYFLASSKLENRLERDARARAAKGAELLVQNAKLEMLTLHRRVEKLARDESLLTALKSKKNQETFDAADRAFQAYRSAGGGKTDIAALLDREGNIIVLQLQDEYQTVTTPKLWKKDDRPIHPALALALKPNPAEAQIVADIYDLGKGLMTVAVAPVIDFAENETIGAVVVAHAFGATEAQRHAALLGAEVVFFNGDQVIATSAVRGGTTQEDTTRHPGLGKALAATGLGKQALGNDSGLSEIAIAEVGGDGYAVAAGKLPRFTSAEKFPTDYPAPAIGATVLFSMDEATSPVGTVKASILLLGAGALIIGLLALFITQRRIVHQADELETGVNEITNGNLELMFRPVGAELDGLANALNVMLARLLGRPEPGEEEYDEEGNIIQPGRLAFDTELSQQDSEVVALAQEPEPDYYKRLYNEYLRAREQAGENVEGVTFDSFVTKLRVNEAGLKKKYQCSAVRFRVVFKDGKVTLKPVPIV